MRSFKAFRVAFFALVMYCSVVFVACGSDSVSGSNEDKSSSSSLKSSSSISEAGGSSSGGVSSSAGGNSNSSSSNASSGSNAASSASKPSGSADDCNFSKKNYINVACNYNKTVTLSRDVSVGPLAKLKFTDGASLELGGYTLSLVGGSELYFSENSSLNVDDWSSLEINGTSSRGVVIGAENNAKWKGITISSYGTTFDAEYLDLSGAQVGIYFGGKGVLKNSKIHDCAEGIKINRPFDSGKFEGNDFRENNYDVRASLENLASLGSPYQFAGKMLVPETETVSDLKLPAFTYRVNGGVYITGVVTIDPGAHFLFSEFSFVTVLSGGIKAVGKTDSPIIFEANDSRGFWGKDESANSDKTAFLFEGGCSITSIFEHFEVLRAKVAFANYCYNALDLSYGKVVDYYHSAYITGGGGSQILRDITVETHSNAPW